MLAFGVLAGGDGEEIDGALAREIVGQDFAHDVETQGVLGGLGKWGFFEGGDFLLYTIGEHLLCSGGDALVEEFSIDVEVDAANPSDILRVESAAELAGGFAGENADLQRTNDAA